MSPGCFAAPLTEELPFPSPARERPLPAGLTLAVEMARHRDWHDWPLLAVLLAPIGFAGSKLSVSFWERERKH